MTTHTLIIPQHTPDTLTWWPSTLATTSTVKCRTWQSDHPKCRLHPLQSDPLRPSQSSGHGRWPLRTFDRLMTPKDPQPQTGVSHLVAPKYLDTPLKPPTDHSKGPNTPLPPCDVRYSDRQTSQETSFFLPFLERGVRDSERKGEKHRLVASLTPPTGTWIATGACPEMGNQPCDLSLAFWRPTHWAHQSGRDKLF